MPARERAAARTGSPGRRSCCTRGVAHPAEAYFSVRPGLTGPWQVEGRNDIPFPERVLMDQAYARQVSFLRDLKIVLLTTRVVLAAGGR